MIDVFSIPDFSFPEGFLWGSSTAGHQIEGNNIHSAQWASEQKKLLKNPGAEVSGMACNHYNMVEEDVQLLTDLGHRAYRMSIEWSRIEPREGEFDTQALDHYIRELELLKSRGIRVFLTLVHFAVPLWFHEKGGFQSLDNRVYFERFLKFVLPRISPYVDFWNVLNEINLGHKEKRMIHKYNSVFYHALGYHLIKCYSKSPVSTAHALAMPYGKRQFDAFDRTMQAYMDLVNNEFFFHAIRTGELVLPFQKGVWDPDIKDSCDFWSVNLYTRDLVDARSPDLSCERYPFSKVKMIPMEFYLDEFYPETMFQSLTRLNDKPVYISENGCSCDRDEFRIVYLAEYLSALHMAMNAGVDVRGYLYWSLLDNWEWGSFLPRFGLVDVDREHDFKRTPKNSAWFYKEIIENNGFSQSILRRYLTEMPKVES